MALDNNLRLAIQAKLKLGISPKDVAEQLDVKLPTVYTINQKLKADKDNETVAELHAIPQDAIVTVVEKARKEAVILPTPQNKNAIAEEFVGQMEAVACGADGLKKLDMSFQATMANVLSRFDKLLKDDSTKLSEIVLISNTAANAYEKVFASGTNIHIGDNNSHSTQQLTVFKNKQGV